MKIGKIIGKLTNSSIKLKIVAALGISSLVIAPAITVPLTMHNQKDNFKVVSFNDHQFNSKSAVIKYIKDNSREVQKKAGQKIYTVSVGNDKQEYETYADAYDYVLNKLHSLTVYKKPNVTEDKNLFTIAPDNFIKTADAIKYVAFAKYSADIKFSKNNDHDYTFAPAINEDDSDNVKAKKQIVLNKARDEAAASYIQMHTAYKFNNIYFYSLNDVRSYIIANWSRRNAFDADKVASSSYKELFLKDNKTIIFDKDQSLDQLKASNVFKTKVLQNATPYYRYKKNNNDLDPQWGYTKISMDNARQLQNHLKEDDLDYIKVNSNEDTVTQIVDMDGSTPNGNIYGPYYVKSGQGMDGIKDYRNWDQVPSNSQLPNKAEMVDISVLKSIINYIMKTKGFSSFLDFLYITTNVKKGPTFMEYLKTAFANHNYAQESFNLIKELAKGVRNNHLDNIIALHSFLINEMIKNNEDSAKIIEVSKYFNSIMKIFDSLLGTFLAPYLSKDDHNNDIKGSEYKINYFQSAFNFYNEDELGKGINFQNNPYSYYRKLVGHSSDNGGRQRNNIFLLAEAAMGIHGISMNALRQNQKRFTLWGVNYQNQLVTNKFNGVPSSYNQQDLKFVNHNDNHNLWDFSFADISDNLKANENGNFLDNLQVAQDEKNSIWDNIQKMKGSIKINEEANDEKAIISINPNSIARNMNDYLYNVQNNYINNYKIKLLKKQKDLRNIFEKNNSKSTSNKFVKKYDKNEDKKLFIVNTLNFISIGKDDIFDNQITTAKKSHHLAQMIKDAVTPLEDRIVDFATKLGTFAAQAAIAVATAGVGAEASLIEENTMTLKSVKVSSWSGKLKNKFITLDRSETYTNTFKITKITKQKPKDENLWKKLNEDAKWESNNSQEQTQNIENALADAYGSIYSFGNDDVKRVMTDIFKVSIGIVKNVLPFIGTLFNIVNSFSSSESQVYSFAHAEKGTALYWNGGLVKYSWWGLSADQKYSIEDLKMISPQEIISGYPQSGFYYGNHMNASLDALKSRQAEDLIEKVLKIDRNNIGHLKNTFKNIFWSIDIQDLTDNNSEFTKNKYTKSTQALVNFAAKYGVTDIAKNVYKTKTGFTSTNLGKIQDEAIKSTLNDLKNVMILKLPELIDKTLQVDKQFMLPYPYWSSGSVKKSNISDNDLETINKNYIIFNPNINLNILSTTLTVPDNKPKLKKIIKASLESMNGQDYEAKEDKLNELIKPYIDNLFIRHKEVVFQELNNHKNVSFEDLDDKWTKKIYTIYSFSTDEGQKKYFTNKRRAIKELLDKNNYSLSENKLGRVTRIYRFNHAIFHSINDIYKFIMHQQEKGGKHEEKI